MNTENLSFYIVQNGEGEFLIKIVDLSDIHQKRCHDSANDRTARKISAYQNVSFELLLNDTDDGLILFKNDGYGRLTHIPHGEVLSAKQKRAKKESLDETFSALTEELNNQMESKLTSVKQPTFFNPQNHN